MLSVLERFESKYIPEPNSGCWIWLAGTATEGYGKFWVDGATDLAHRVSWRLAGRATPSNTELDHLCRNRLCCNPDHLEPVSHRENMLRGVSPTALTARSNFCKNGHEFTVENTYYLANGWRRCHACGRAAAKRCYDRNYKRHAT